MSLIQTLTYGLHTTSGILLSLGPSQLYGIIKGVISGIHYFVCHYKKDSLKNELNALIQKTQNVAEPLLHEDITPDTQNKKALADLKEKITIIDSDLSRHLESIQIAALSLIPVAGALLASHFAGHAAFAIGPLVEDILRELPSSVSSFLLFPGCEHSAFYKQRWTNDLNAEQVYIPVEGADEIGKKTRKIEAMHLRGKHLEEKKENALSNSPGTVVLSHGNGATLYGMYHEAKAYQEKGFDVLVTTLGGTRYQQIDSQDTYNDFYTTELSLYQDVDAIMQYLATKGTPTVLWHGISMGGAAAFQAALKYGLNSPQRDPECTLPLVTHLIAEQTFTSASEVSSNLANNLLGFQSLGFAIGKGIAPIGYTDGKNTTDGLDNKKKAALLKQSKVKLLTVQATKDIIMGKEPNDQGVYAKNFAKELLEARYTQEEGSSLVTLEGQHVQRSAILSPHATTLYNFLHS